MTGFHVILNDMRASADVSWQADAACRAPGIDPDWFFPPTLQGVFTGARAVEICNTCPVREACLDHAIEQGERYGIWGGMSERHRINEARRRRKAARHAELTSVPTRQETTP